VGSGNRQLIPNLIIKLWPASPYPKLKATGITDKAGKELADIVKTLSDAQAIKPDAMLRVFAPSVLNGLKATRRLHASESVGAQGMGPDVTGAACA